MQTKHPLPLLAILGAAVVSTAAQADAPRYDYVDVAYQSINDPASSGYTSDHAYGIDGSYAVTDNFLIGASYAHENADFAVPGLSGTASADSYSAGVGYRFPLSSNVDLVPTISYDSSKSSFSASLGGASQTNTGYDVDLALRAKVTDALEITANVDHSTPGSSSNSLGVGALYNLTHNFALGVGYGSSKSNGQTTSAWTVIFRYYFK